MTSEAATPSTEPTEPTGPVGSSRTTGEHHHDHRDVTGGWLRPAVFGVTDGLVSNTALIVGVAGAHVSPHSVVLTGLAGLAAGAFSMATGEYISVASQAELTRAEIEIEKAEIKRVPQAEEAELAALYRARGVDADVAKEVARQLSLDHEQAWRVHAREELGVDPDDLPSPWTAAGSSFVAFAIGAVLPVLPYLLGATTLPLSIALAGMGLFGAGALVSRFTTRTWWYSGARQMLLGAASALVTYLIGSAVGS
ncbi:MAG: VIT1/CCC1 transporter family protein [Mycobacteriales bacterium]